MKNTNLILFLIAILLSGCQSCTDTLITYTVALGSIRMEDRCISGQHYLTPSRIDSHNSYTQNGPFLCVMHDPDCGISGNSGSDIFFDSNHPLPPGCSVKGLYYFKQFWPVGICDNGKGGIGGWGSYGATINGGGNYSYYVNWNNACQGDFGGKKLYYSVSFIISAPVGTDLGETSYPSNILYNSPCLPSQYLEYHPSNCPSASQNGTTPPPPSVYPFYFKITCPSEVTPCYTEVIYAKDLETAKAYSHNIHTNCTENAITASEFNIGCH